MRLIPEYHLIESHDPISPRLIGYPAQVEDLKMPWRFFHYLANLWLHLLRHPTSSSGLSGHLSLTTLDSRRVKADASIHYDPQKGFRGGQKTNKQKDPSDNGARPWYC